MARIASKGCQEFERLPTPISLRDVLFSLSSLTSRYTYTTNAINSSMSSTRELGKDTYLLTFCPYLQIWWYRYRVMPIRELPLQHCTTPVVRKTGSYS